MSSLLGGVAGLLVTAGIVLVVAGCLLRIDEPSKAVRRRSRLSLWWEGAGAVTRRRAAIGLAAGFVVFVITGAVVLLVAVPVCSIVLPGLLADPGNRDIEVLEALDRWVRSLVSSIPTGKSVPDAIRATAGQAPELLRDPVHLVLARMDDRWSPDEALRAMADELDAPEADAVIAALILCARRGGTGAAATLGELSETVQNRLRALREIEAERSKPRVVVRQVTAITVIVLAGGMLLNPGYFAPYWTPMGQLVLAVLLVCFVLPLVVLRRMTLPRRRERILARSSQPEAVGVHA